MYLQSRPSLRSSPGDAILNSTEDVVLGIGDGFTFPDSSFILLMLRDEKYIELGFRMVLLIWVSGSTFSLSKDESELDRKESRARFRTNAVFLRRKAPIHYP